MAQGGVWSPEQELPLIEEGKAIYIRSLNVYNGENIKMFQFVSYIIVDFRRYALM